MSSESNAADAERDLHDALAFFGSITASVTHELNNVFGTIDQVAGLLEDLAQAHSKGREVSSERLSTVAERIGRQAERGAALTKRLNLFAHSPDYAVSEFSLNDAIQNLTSLMDRLARMQRIELSLSLPDEDIPVESDRFLVLQIMFHLVQAMISVAARDTVVEIAVAARENDVLVTIEASCEDTANTLSVGGQVDSLAAMLSGRIEKAAEDERIRLKFGFPVRRESL